MSAAGRRIAESCGIAVSATPLAGSPYVLVDVSTWSQVGDAAARIRDAPHALLDHHAYGDDFATAAFALRDPERSSTCEIALDVLLAAGVQPTPATGRALLAGILADSGRFRWGNVATLRAALALAEAGATTEEASGLLEEEDEDDRSARIARLKSARRARFYAAGDRVVAATVVGAHEAACAIGLVRLGADCAVVATATDDGARVTARAAAGFPVHLGEAFNALARAHPEAGSAGGGHEGSAGLRATGSAEAWLAAALDAIVAQLGGGRELA